MHHILNDMLFLIVTTGCTVTDNTVKPSAVYRWYLQNYLATGRLTWYKWAHYTDSWLIMYVQVDLIIMLLHSFTYSTHIMLPIWTFFYHIDSTLFMVDFNHVFVNKTCLFFVHNLSIENSMAVACSFEIPNALPKVINVI